MRRIAYRASEVAELLGVSVRTIYKWMDSREIASVVIGRSRFVSAAEVERIRNTAKNV